MPDVRILLHRDRDFRSSLYQGIHGVFVIFERDVAEKAFQRDEKAEKKTRATAHESAAENVETDEDGQPGRETAPYTAAPFLFSSFDGAKMGILGKLQDAAVYGFSRVVNYLALELPDWTLAALHDGAFVDDAIVSFDGRRFEKALQSAGAIHVLERAAVGHLFPEDFVDDILVVLDGLHDFFAQLRRDFFVGVKEENVIAAAMLEQTVPLFPEALPVCINNDLCT